MQRQAKRGLQAQHMVQPDSSDRMANAKVVAGGLNRGHGKPGFERIEQLVQDLNEIDQIARKAGYPPLIDDIYLGKLGERARQLRRRVDRFLRAARFRALPGMPGQHGWRIELYLRFSNSSYYLASLILDTAFSGHLRKVAQCSTCKAWFVMHKGDHRACSDKCREKDFRASDKGRAKRAEYMRRYRAGLRRRDRENLRVSRSKNR